MILTPKKEIDCDKKYIALVINSSILKNLIKYIIVTRNIKYARI